MPYDPITGQYDSDTNAPQDVLKYIEDYTEGKSLDDSQEKSMELAEKAIASPMRTDKAMLYEQTKDKSSWLSTIDVLKRSVGRIDDELWASVLKTHAGYEAASVTDKDWMTRTLRQANEESDAFSESIYNQYGDKQVAPFIPIKLTDIAALPQSISFSLVSMGAGLATALPIAAAPVPGARLAAWAAGTVVSGKAAYEIATYEIGQAYLEALNEEEALTPETEREAKEFFSAAAQRYGLWEAVPEAISNAAFAGIIGAKFAKMGISKTIAGKVAAKLGSLYGEEMITEAVTQWGQARIEEEYGMREPGKGQISPWQALKEVAPQTFLLTSIMGGAGATAVGITRKAKAAFAKEVKAKNLAPDMVANAERELDSYIGDVIKQQQEVKKQNEKMTKDAMNGQMGWIDKEGVYHEANEPKPIEDIEGEPVSDQGIIPETGKPFEFSYIRNKEKSPDAGARFGQDKEPAGKYMIVGKAENVQGEGFENFETGTTKFENPLVVEFGEGYGEKSNWKNVVSEQFGGKTGAELTKALREAGYDGIVTVSTSTDGSTKYTSEILDLRIEQKPKAKPKPKKKPTVIPTAIKNINKFQERLKDTDIKKRKDVQKEADAVVNELKKSKLLNTYRRRQLVEKINKMAGISTPEGREKFSKVLDEAREEIETVQKRRDLKEKIAKKKLQRTENLRQAMKLPTIKKMNLEQLNGFIELLDQYQEGDIFLSKRQIETVDNTDLDGIRTMREAREALAKETGATEEELANIRVGNMDWARHDTRLEKQNPLYRVMIQATHRAFIGANLRYMNFERKMEKLTTAARKSRKRSLIDRAIPTDQAVFEWLSADDKAAVEEKYTMTPQELELAMFLQDEYAKALEYLIKHQTLKEGIRNYITNLRRGFLEGLKEGGIRAGIKEMFDAQKQDLEKFQILDQDTGMILPLEKFFQFAMKRSGKINPTKNVAKASSVYFRTFYKKIALDSIMPKIMIYAQALTSTKMTQAGLEVDRSIKNFVKTYFNTKKGRKAQSGLLKQGGPLDIAILTLKSLISIWDLGFNIPVQIAAMAGETVAGYVTLGKKNMAKGIARLATPKGRAFVDKFEGFTGKSLWRELIEPSKDIGDKAMTAVFGLFNSSSTRMNKISLLGMITDEEYNSGEVSEKRLAQIKLDIGKMRMMEGGKSIVEATTAGGIITQYKSWAIPILGTVSSDIGNLIKKLKKGEAMGSEELTRLRRVGEITLFAVLAGAMLGGDKDDYTFLGQLKKKVRRELLTIMGAMTPGLWLATPRLLSWLEELGVSIDQLITLEQYKDPEDAKMKGKSKYKGVEAMKRILTPSLARMILPDKDATGKYDR